MNPIFRRCIRDAALAAVLCACAVQVFAQAEGNGWQEFFNVDVAQEGEPEKRLIEAQSALALAEATENEKDLAVVFILLTLASHQNTATQYKKLLVLNQRAQALSEKCLGLDHAGTALSLNLLASTYGALAQHDRALLLQIRALTISEKILGTRDLAIAQNLSQLASTYSALAKYDTALSLNIRALEISEKLLRTEDLRLAQMLSELASSYTWLAQYDQAIVFNQRALAIRKQNLGEDHAATVLSMRNLARNYRELGEYQKALPLNLRALVAMEKVYGTFHPIIAGSLNDLAVTHVHLAQYGKALLFQQRSLAITEQALGPMHPATASNLSDLAIIYIYLEQYDKALALQQRALLIEEQILGPDHPDTAQSLNNLAGIFNNLGQHDKALPLLERSLEIKEKVLGLEHPDTALSLHNLSLTYIYLAQYDKALPIAQRALAIRQKTLGSVHPDTAISLGTVASIYSETGMPDLAIALYKSTINMYQNQRERVSAIGATELRSYTESISVAYQNLAVLLIDQGRLSEAQLVLDMLKEEEQFEFIRRSATSDPRSTRIGLNSTEQVWMNRYRQIADRLAALGVEELALQKQVEIGLSQEQKQRKKNLAADLQIAQKAFDSFLGEMREGFAHQGVTRAVETEELSQKAMRDQQDLVKGMGNDVVLLRYYVTEDKVGMLLTTPGMQLARSTKINAKELNRQIAEFRRLLRDPKSNPLPVAQALYALLVAPVAHDLELAGAKTVMLSLDGALRYLPFGALHDGQRYLVQRWNLPMYTSVTKNRLRDDVTPQWQAAGLGVTRALGEFSALPAVKAEMSSIIKTAGRGVLPGEVYLDGAFTAQRLQDVSKRNFQLLHVASHFRFSPGTEVNSFLLLGDGQQLTLGDIRTQNYRFDNVDLLTLSACDTGLGGGRDEKGREIEGFGVIAQQQGAKAVLATLWPVADQSTATLMAEMYRRRQEQRLTKIEALRQAQLSLLAQSRYAHPFYWAPFILMGNWK